MKITYDIFFGVSILLILVVYVSSSINDAYAAIRDPKFDTGTCEEKGDKKTCCWVVPGTGVIKIRVTYCQTCTYYHDSNGEAYEKCTDPKKQTIQAQQTLPGSNLPQDLPQLQLAENNTNSDNSLNSKLVQKGALQFERTDNNTTPSDDSSKTEK